MPDFPSSTHYEMLVRGERALADALPLIEKAESCGVDCGEFREGHTFMRERLARFRSAYFPDATVGPNPAGVPTSG